MSFNEFMALLTIVAMSIKMVQIVIDWHKHEAKMRKYEAERQRRKAFEDWYFDQLVKVKLKP